MRSWFGRLSVVVALIAGVVGTVLIARGGDDATADKNSAKNASAPAPPPIQGLQMAVDGLIYNVTDVRRLDFDSPSAAPYLTNLQRPGKGSAYLGVFLRVYNPTNKPMASAAGYLLEPSKRPVLVEQVKNMESPYSFRMGATVPAKSVIPTPGTAAASGKFPGGLLLFGITGETTKAQPLDLVVHTAKGGIAKLRLPPVEQVNGKSSHG
jgi:hypothetical protein